MWICAESEVKEFAVDVGARSRESRLYAFADAPRHCKPASVESELTQLAIMELPDSRLICPTVSRARWKQIVL